MGVRGLMSYITRRKQFFSPFELKNQTVIFHGQTVAHWIATNSDFDLQFSGDSDIYYTSVQDYFKDFLYCGITPVVIMNGPALEIDGMKVVEKAIQSILIGNDPGSFITPMTFMIDIFLQVLRDLKVKHYCCDGDVHKEIARLAQEHNCPVISFDSDFFIYDVPFIPLMFSFIDFRWVKQKRCISCYIFDRDKFLKIHGLELPTLPVVATAIGKYWTESEWPKYFYRNAGLATQQEGHFNGSWNNTYVDIPATTAIFQGLDTKSAAANKFLSYFSAEEIRIEAREELKKNFEYYDIELKDDVTDAIPVSDRIKSLLKTGEMMSVAGLVRRNSFYISVGLFEDLNKPSTADLCWDFIAGIYTFLQRQKENPVHMTCYFRNGVEVNQKEMTVDDSLGFKPGEMTVEERQAAFYKVADLDWKDITVMKMFPRSWQLFIAALQFWSKKMRTDKDFRPYHFHAVFLNMLLVIARRKALSKNKVVVSKERDGDSASNCVANHLMDVEVGEWRELLPVYGRFRRRREKSNETKDREPCDKHFEMCLLVVMEYVNALSLVMGTTLKPIRYEKFWNGGIVYSLMERLKSSDNVLESVFDLLKPSTKIRNFYEFLCSSLHCYIPQEDN